MPLKMLRQVDASEFTQRGAVVGTEDYDGIVCDHHFFQLLAVQPHLIVEIFDVSVDARFRHGAMGVIFAFVSGDERLGPRVLLPVPFNNWCTRPALPVGSSRALMSSA